MAREGDFKTRMTGDATLMAILTGGVFVSGETGRDGLTRGDIAGSDGWIRPAALVRERAVVPDGWVHDQEAQHASARQVVEIWLYEDSGYTNIDAALARLYILFQGYRLSGAFPLEWVGTLNRERDEGALLGASMARQDWLVADVIGE